MRQIIFSLTENADEILIFLCGFIILLLIVLLHRIGNLSKMIQENLVNIRRGQADIAKSPSEKTMLTEAEVQALLSGEEYAKEQSKKASMQQEMLLAEVLDEVFL